MSQVLILGGTAEARLLATRLSGQAGVKPLVSLSGATTAPLPQGVPTRTGGFGGPAGLAAWLADHSVAAVIDATHPYATAMQANAAVACAEVGTPRLRLLRPEWPFRPHHIRARTLAEAAALLPSKARVLLTTGQKDLAPFADRVDVSFTLRTIEGPGPLPRQIQSLLARPPFTLEQEIATLSALGATHLVTKNAGGSGTAKLDAADYLQLTTVIVDRPAAPPGPVAETVDGAVAWLAKIVGFE